MKFSYYILLTNKSRIKISRPEFQTVKQSLCIMLETSMNFHPSCIHIETSISTKKSGFSGLRNISLWLESTFMFEMTGEFCVSVFRMKHQILYQTCNYIEWRRKEDEGEKKNNEQEEKECCSCLLKVLFVCLFTVANRDNRSITLKGLRTLFYKQTLHTNQYPHWVAVAAAKLSTKRTHSPTNAGRNNNNNLY